MKKIIHFLVVWVALFFWINPVDADERVMEDLLFEEIPMVSSAIGRVQKQSEVSHPISVITKEDIARSGARDVSELFYKIPGVQTRTNMGFTSFTAIRSASTVTTPNLLVLIDGAVMFNPVFNGTYWENLPVALNEIERIEIIRGPGGVLYAANAVNGVINIITKSAEDHDDRYVDVRGGSHYYKEFEMGVGGLKFADDKLLVRAWGHADDKDGVKKRYPNIPTNSSLHRYIAGFQADYLFSEDASLKVSAAFSKTNGYLFSYDSSFYQAPRGFAVLNLNYDQKINDVYDFTVHVDQTEHYDTIVDQKDTDIHTSAATMQHNFRFEHDQLGKHIVSAGADWRRNVVNVEESQVLTEAHPTQILAGFFFQDEFRPWDELILTGGARLDKNTITRTNPNKGGWFWSPRFSAVYTPDPNHVIHTSVTRTHRMPAILDKLSFLPFGGGAVVLLGEDELTPEKVWNYDLGYRGTLLDNKLAFNAVVYYYTVESVLSFTPIMGGSPLTFTRDNLGNLKTLGFEMDGEYKLTDDLTLNWDYTYINPRRHTGSANVNFTASVYQISTQQVGAGVQYTKGPWEADFYVKYISKYGTISTLSGATKVSSFVKPELRVAYNFELPGAKGEKYDSQIEFVAKDFIGARTFESLGRFYREPIIYGGLKVDF